jgi:hypothetical protein
MRCLCGQYVQQRTQRVHRKECPEWQRLDMLAEIAAQREGALDVRLPDRDGPRHIWTRDDYGCRRYYG